MSEKYAYGDWKVDGEKCPLSSAEKENKYYSKQLAREFDEVAKDMTGEYGKGTMSKQKAADAWNKLVNYLSTRTQRESFYANNTDIEYLQNLLVLAKEVQEEEFSDD